MGNSQSLPDDFQGVYIESNRIKQDESKSSVFEYSLKIEVAPFEDYKLKFELTILRKDCERGPDGRERFNEREKAFLIGTVESGEFDKEKGEKVIKFITEKASYHSGSGPTSVLHSLDQDGGKTAWILQPNDDYKVNFEMRLGKSGEELIMKFVSYPKLQFKELTGILKIR